VTAKISLVLVAKRNDSGDDAYAVVGSAPPAAELASVGRAAVARNTVPSEIYRDVRCAVDPGCSSAATRPTSRLSQHLDPLMWLFFRWKDLTPGAEVFVGSNKALKNFIAFSGLV
jgi:hypothetical protein